MDNNGQTTQAPQGQLPKQLVAQMKKIPGGTMAVDAINHPPTPPTGQQIEGQPAQLQDQDKRNLIDKVTGHIQRMLTFRRQYDSRRSLFYRQYLSQRDQKLFPDNITPRSNTFSPYPQSNVETIVSRVMDAFFSYEDWFECKPRAQADDNSAEHMQKVLMNKLHKANFISTFTDMIKNICIYGHGAIKIDWDWEYETVTYAEPQFALTIDPNTGAPTPISNPMTGQPVVIGYKPAVKQVARNRPKFYAIDVYDLLVDPDGGLTVHLTERTWGQMVRESQANPNLYDPQALKELSDRIMKEKDPSSVIVRIAEFWNDFDQTRTLITVADDREAIAWKDLRYAIRSGNSYSGFRRKMYGGPPLLLFHGANPFIHKRTPILHTSYIKLPNEVYGLGAIEIISQLTEAFNTMVNMITDNWNMGINRRYAYDTNMDIDHDALKNANTPGGQVAVSGDPSKVIMPLPFFTPQRGDYALLDVYKTQIETASGVSDFYNRGIGGAQGNETATGINSVLQESNFRFKMFIRNLELDVLQPLLEMCAMLVQQYVTEPEELMITDEQTSIKRFYSVAPEELLGSFDFDLVAANYATNKIVRQRNLLALANLAAQSEYMNEYEALREIAKVFEVRNVNKMLKTPQQVAMEQAAAQKQQIDMMILESMLQTESKARISQSKPKTGQGAGGGAPRTSQFEGKIPGAGLTSEIRHFAQSMGSNALGTAGASESGS